MNVADYESLRSARRALLGFEAYGLDLYGSPPSENQAARVTAVPSCDEALRALGPVARRTCCRGGTVQLMSDDWGDCGGCCECAGVHTAGYRLAYAAGREPAARALFEACRGVGIFVWRASQIDAHTALYQSLRGYEALAAIGTAIARIAAVGIAVTAFLRAASQLSRVPTKGYWYKVDGKRGKARAHQGVEGECVWIGENTYVQERPGNWRGTWNGRASTTIRVGLLPLGAEKPIYVPASCIVRAKMPAEAAVRKAARDLGRAQRKVRPNYYGRTGKKGDRGCVVAGEHKGKVGRVFWSKVLDVLGADAKVGMEIVKGADAIWPFARDVVGPAARFADFAKFEIERVEEGAAKADRLDAVLAGAYACAEALDDAGFEKEAQEWAAVTKQIEAMLSNVAEVAS